MGNKFKTSLEIRNVRQSANTPGSQTAKNQKEMYYIDYKITLH